MFLFLQILILTDQLFQASFCPFTFLAGLIIKILKNKKMPREFMTLEQCTKNYDNVRLGHGDMAWDKTDKLFWAKFCPLRLYRGSKDQKF